MRLELNTSIGVGGFRKLSRRDRVSVLAALESPAKPQPMSKTGKRALFDKRLAEMRGQKD